MRPMSRLSVVLASASAGFCICLYTLIGLHLIQKLWIHQHQFLGALHF